VSDYKNWKSEEEEKHRKAKDAVDHIRQERDRQMREAKLNHQEMLEKKQKEEEAEVLRFQLELVRQEEEALEKKRQQHYRMRGLLVENTQVQKEKEKQKSMEQFKDIKLMEDYAQKLAKEEQERNAALQHKLHRQDRIQNGIAVSIHEQMRRKALDDEKRAEDYQRQKQEADILREQVLYVVWILYASPRIYNNLLMCHLFQL